jgi:hypothetical protein
MAQKRLEKGRINPSGVKDAGVVPSCHAPGGLFG